MLEQLSILQYKVVVNESLVSHEMTSVIQRYDDLLSCAEAISQSFPLHLQPNTRKCKAVRFATKCR